MHEQIYFFLAAVIVLMTVGRIIVVWRRGAKAVDWELVVAFIRLDFPPSSATSHKKLPPDWPRLSAQKSNSLSRKTGLGRSSAGQKSRSR